MQHLAKQFRDQAAATFGGVRHRTRYPEALKALGCRFIEQARRAGAEERDIADALGVSSATTRVWLPPASLSPERPPVPRPRLVRVLEEAGGVEPAAPIARYVVRGPRGLTIECDAGSLVELLRALS
jgi:hypothetical protein